MRTISRLPPAQLQASEEHVEAFKALAHLSRLQVSSAVEIPGPTLSHHLDLLRRAGLLESRKEERYVYYCVKRDSVTALVRLLTACC